MGVQCIKNKLSTPPYGAPVFSVMGGVHAVGLSLFRSVEPDLGTGMMVMLVRTSASMKYFCVAVHLVLQPSKDLLSYIRSERYHDIRS